MSRRKSSRQAVRPAAPGACPCGRSTVYDDCCGRLHRGQARATTAEQLMRSRFSAFARHDEAYLLRSWHPSTRPPGITFDPALRWIALDILGTSDGSPFHDTGVVEFRARYSERGRAGELHETSRFVRENGDWLYVDGTVG